MAKIYVTREIPGKALDQLKTSGNEVEVSPFDRPLTKDELIEKGKGADGILTLLTDKITGEILDAVGPQLKIVSNYAVGFDNVNMSWVTKNAFYVAMTRARKSLHILTALKSGGASQAHDFLDQLPGEHMEYFSYRKSDRIKSQLQDKQKFKTYLDNLNTVSQRRQQR